MKSTKRNRSIYWYVLIIISLVLVMSTGCFSYGEPKIEMNSVVQQISADEATKTITYEVVVTIKNNGANNAHDLSVLALVSTPPDQPEYRINSGTIDVGTLKKGETTTKTISVPLPVTDLHYQKMVSGEVQPYIETKVSRVSSNIMG